MRNFMEEESIADANSIPSDTLSHTSNKQRNNASAIFISQKLDNILHPGRKVPNLDVLGFS